MCYARPGGRCTPHAEANLRRAKTKFNAGEFAAIQAGQARGTSDAATRTHLHRRALLNRAMAEYDLCPVGRAEVASLGAGYKAAALEARRVGDRQAEAKYTKFARETASRYQDAYENSKAAKDAANKRRQRRRHPERYVEVTADAVENTENTENTDNIRDTK